MEESNLGESSRQGMNGALWSRIWQANVPNKIKIFSWRACLNILPTQANLQQVWQPPVGNCFKLNFDGACFDDGAASGYGAVIRNEKSEVMAPLAAKGGAVWDSEEVEVFACRKALEFTIDAGFMEIILEGDSFRSISINCVRRTANGVAHALARFTRLINDDIVWLEEDPPPMVDALYLDANALN
ncbi:uncharacterized protein LOC115985415 [Quercus lobata]|uniref:uncharacterized protein LOC115985415 n=1 Tax=Quercus lobata TaxID=97700 RepID=UPI001245F9F9|nr:uncharacterized protein LOC115985415 [Quercus lobata]